MSYRYFTYIRYTNHTYFEYNRESERKNFQLALLLLLLRLLRIPVSHIFLNKIYTYNAITLLIRIILYYSLFAIAICAICVCNLLCSRCFYIFK